MTDVKTRVAKNLREAIFKAFELKEQVVSADLMAQLQGEIQDFLAHEIMTFEDESPERMQVLMDFFQKVITRD
jgi:hypothetical protein